MLDNYPEDFAFVQIHVSDDYATTWGNQRANYYTDFQYLPTSYFDGVIARVGAQSYATYQSDLLNRLGQPTDVSISLGGTQVSGSTFQITASVCLDAGGTSKTVRVYIVQVLDDWPTNPSYSRNGVKQGATTADVSLVPGDCQSVVRTMTFDATSWANQDDITIIAWAQEPQSSSSPSNRAEVYNAAIMNWPFITDCNGNGIDDAVDIANCGGELWCADCNSNGVPDGCEVDCNGNQIPDDCDIAAGTSEDCDGNGVPDECDILEYDCNGNLIPDACDIMEGTSLDCNSNIIPDECEEDCNLNGVPDDCDVWFGTSLDCNNNLTPDECELDGNDCNGNLVPDDCDIAGATSEDCNLNQIPDECDLASGYSLDCNGNSVPDECDVAFGTSPDCNTNAIPDECDVAEGTSPDCNGNGIPDSCDLVALVETDWEEYTPCGSGYPHTYTMYNVSEALTDVTLSFQASGDLNFSSEFVEVYLEGTLLGQIYGSGVVTNDCPMVPDEDSIVVPMADFNAAAADTTVEIEMVASAGVDPDRCDPDPSYIRIQVTYETEAADGDCNGNGVPDECDLNDCAGDPACDDCNSNGVLDECDIAAGTSEDTNGNGIPDECESGQDWCLGDMNCSGGAPDFVDILFFAAAVGNEQGWRDYYDAQIGGEPPCPWLLGDFGGGAGVEFSDIVPFANSVGQACIPY